MKIAAYQFAVTHNIDNNFETVVKAVRTAKEKGIELVVFPECALTGYPPRDMASSSDVDFLKVEECCNKLQSLCDETDVAFILGTIAKENDKIYNRAVFFRPESAPVTYDKRALWGWDRDNFTSENPQDVYDSGCMEDGCTQHNIRNSVPGIVDHKGFRIGIRICFEIRFPEFFRELYKEKTDLNAVLFYDVTDEENNDRYNMIKGHIETRAVENVCTFITANTTKPYQTAPTAVFGRSGQTLAECARGKEGFAEYDLEKKDYDFGEQGRKEISDLLTDSEIRMLLDQIRRGF
ncbi:MAG: carbon-nitrogen hydrolase family protein [Lachnospiraceae bacterium]|nr:carbon-nitrogen hydrolase family protein [Lachnospiraceae bacterium]